jgi:hypothetical protein
MHDMLNDEDGLTLAKLNRKPKDALDIHNKVQTHRRKMLDGLEKKL